MPAGLLPLRSIFMCAAQTENYQAVLVCYWTLAICMKFRGLCLSDAAAALQYGADNGARVSSNSYEGGGYVSLMRDAINYFNEAGGIVVAACVEINQCVGC